MADAEWVPLKGVLALCKISRATLWRVARSGAAFPDATRRAGKLYWRAAEIDAIKSAIAAFEGRTIFDARRRQERKKATAQYERMAVLKRTQRRMRRPKAVKAARQADLFDAPLPSLMRHSGNNLETSDRREEAPRAPATTGNNPAT